MTYKCTNCSYVYDDKQTGVDFSDLAEKWTCPNCHAPKSFFIVNDNLNANDNILTKLPIDDASIAIQQITVSGESVGEAFGSRLRKNLWQDVFLMGASLARKPLEASVEVNTKTVIGKSAANPMEIEMPIIISHMGLGAVNSYTKASLAKASQIAKTAMGSGDGGILRAEFDQAYKYIFEYTPAKYSVSDKNLEQSDAIEIKIGQAAKFGIGSTLSGEKVTTEVAEVRGVKQGEAVSIPASFEEIKEPWDLLLLVNDLRERSGGRPVGIKIAAGNIEEDLKWIQEAKPDFITIDGYGGGTGYAPTAIKDSMGIPVLYALSRARRFIDKNNIKLDLIVSGGLRTSQDFIKALAMGADAVAVATSVLTALATKTDLTPEKKVANFLETSNEELKTFTRALGYNDVHEIGIDDLATTNSEISNNTNIKHA